ncbi:MAG: GatB/YqeY domain-containing protein [Methylophilaceae bacterium]|nr:GatB/YqeY domain-containing protein [Methylophilaceae bacterium]
MSLKVKISEDMKNAMRSKDSARLGAIRLLQSALKQKEVDERIVIGDDDVLIIIEKMLKQRRDSIDAFKKADRQDLVENEEFEVSVLMQYMPEPLEDDEIINIIDQTIKNLSASTMKDMGAVMNAVKPKLSGKANMADVSQKIKSKLS